MPASKSPRTSRPALLACLECRRAHLKCDGAVPVCARCASRGASCNYTASQRGRRKGARPASDRTGAVHNLSSSSHPCPSSRWIPEPETELQGMVMPIDLDQTSNDTQSELPSLPALPVFPASPSGNNRRQIESPQQWVDDARLVNLYYLNFHPNHPILLPRSLYWKRAYPRFLKAVVELIGSHFLGGPLNHTLPQDITRDLEDRGQDTTELIQARILYATLLLSRGESSLCKKMRSCAVESALRLGLYRQDFASSYAGHQPVEEESMRRTWYELYVLDGCLTAFQREAIFQTNTVVADVLLPCEESQYDSETPLLHAVSPQDFELSAFSDQESTFSSNAYRIEAVRLLGRVLKITGQHGVQREQVQAADNALAAFLHNLPQSKREPEIVKTSGEVDWLMLQTNVIVQYATILLHFPRGDLTSPSSFAADIVGPDTAKFICPCTRQHVHSIKAIDASTAISMLAALRIPAQKYTPLFIPPLVHSAVVQLSLCAMHAKSTGSFQEQRLDRVKLLLGVLKSMGHYWKMAEVLLPSLKRVALREFRASQNGVPESSTQGDSANSSVFMPQGVMGRLCLDDGENTQLNELMELNELMGFGTDAFGF